MTKKILSALAALTLILALMAPAAMAQSSQDGYIEEGPAVLDRTEGDGGEPPTREPVSGDELPFTGLDLGLVAVAGGSLLLLGVGMRRLTRAPDSV